MKANKKIGYVSLTIIIASLFYLIFGENGNSITEKIEPTCEFCPLQKNDTTIFDTRWQSTDGFFFKFERPFRKDEGIRTTYGDDYIREPIPLQNTIVDWKYFNGEKGYLSWNLVSENGYSISRYGGAIKPFHIDLYFYFNSNKDSLKIVCKSNNTYYKNPNYPETTYFKRLTQ